MEINGKFKKGDKVYTAELEYSPSFISCPDCLGTLKWLVVFADDTSEQIECQTCKKGFTPATGEIEMNCYKGIVRERTIGSVKYDDTNKSPFSYMCEETGIGSGRIYYEEDVFFDRSDASKRAKELRDDSVKRVAQNNFSKKFGGTKEIERALSSYGYSRKAVLEKVRKFRDWCNLSEII